MFFFNPTSFTHDLKHKPFDLSRLHIPQHDLDTRVGIGACILCEKWGKNRPLSATKPAMILVIPSQRRGLRTDFPLHGL